MLSLCTRYPGSNPGADMNCQVMQSDAPPSAGLFLVGGGAMLSPLPWPAEGAVPMHWGPLEFFIFPTFYFSSLLLLSGISHAFLMLGSPVSTEWRHSVVYPTQFWWRLFYVWAQMCTVFMDKAFQCSAPSRVYSSFISFALTFINTCPVLYQLPPLSLVVESEVYRAGRANEQAASHRTLQHEGNEDVEAKEKEMNKIEEAGRE